MPFSLPGLLKTFWSSRRCVFWPSLACLCIFSHAWTSLTFKSVGHVNCRRTPAAIVHAHPRAFSDVTHAVLPSQGLRLLGADLPSFRFCIPMRGTRVVHLHFEQQDIFFTNRGFSVSFASPGPPIDVLQLLEKVSVWAISHMSRHVFRRRLSRWKASGI